MLTNTSFPPVSSGSEPSVLSLRTPLAQAGQAAYPAYIHPSASRELSTDSIVSLMSTNSISRRHSDPTP